MGILLGEKKYEAKTKIMGDRWADAKPIIPDHYESKMNELAREVGKTRVKKTFVDALKAGIDPITAADFTAAVTGKGKVWRKNYTDKMFE